MFSAVELRAVSLILLLILASLAPRSAAQVLATAIRIRPDGEVEPRGAPLLRNGTTYYLTRDLEVWGYDGIVVETDNVVIDGRGHKLAGDKTPRTSGLLLVGRRNVTIVNIAVEDFHYGVRLVSSQLVEIVNATLSSCVEGVSVADSLRVRVRESRLLGNAAGLSGFHSARVEVIDSRVEGGIWGIYLLHVSEGSILSSVVANCSWAAVLLSSPRAVIVGSEFWRCGLYVDDSLGNTVVNNTVNGKPLVYLEGAVGASIREAGQVVLVRSRRVVARGLAISRASVAIQLWETSDSTIESSNLTDNIWGILLHNSTGNIVRGNLVYGNEVGIYLYESRNNTVSSNALLRNQLGLWLACSSANRVYENCFIENRDQASAGCGENVWRGGPRGVGNYWSDWTSVDNDDDGVVDEPYRVGRENVDEKPLLLCPLGGLIELPAPRCVLTPLNGTEVLAGSPTLVKVEAEGYPSVKAVRFLGLERSQWTSWFEWHESRGAWDASLKVAKLTPGSPGEVEITAEVKDAAGRLARCSIKLEVKERSAGDTLAPPYSIAVAAACGVLLAYVARKGMRRSRASR